MKLIGIVWAVAIGFVAMAASTPLSAQQASPQAFLESIYRPYLDKNSKGTSLSTPADVRRYFADRLAAAILKDRAAADKRNEPPTLNGDPFIDAQDWEIANLKIAVKVAGEKAVGTVSFTNAGKAKSVTLDMIKTLAGWRIVEIRAPSGSLRKLMKLR